MKIKIENAYSETLDGEDSNGKVLSIQIRKYLLSLGVYKK